MKQTKTLLLTILFSSLTLKTDASNFFNYATQADENAVTQKPLSGKRKGVIRFFIACGVVYLGGSTLRAHFGKSTKKRESIEMQPLDSSREQSPTSVHEAEHESDNEVVQDLTARVQANSTSQSLLFMSSEQSDTELPPVPKKRTPPITISGSSSTLEKRASAHLETGLVLADTASNNAMELEQMNSNEREPVASSSSLLEFAQQGENRDSDAEVPFVKKKATKKKKKKRKPVKERLKAWQKNQKRVQETKRKAEKIDKATRKEFEELEALQGNLIANEAERNKRARNAYLEEKIKDLKQKKNILKTFVKNKPNDDTTNQKKIEIARIEKELKRLQAITGKEKPAKNTGLQAGFLNRNSQPNKRLSSVLPSPLK